MVLLDSTKFTITTDLENKLEMEAYFYIRNIEFTCVELKRKDHLYADICRKWDLPEFSDSIIDEIKHVVFHIPLEEKNNFISDFCLKTTNSNWHHYKRTPRPKIKSCFKYEKNKYPIYVVSFKRSNYVGTCKELEVLNLDYFVCIRSFQRNDYENFFTENGYRHYKFLLCDSDEEGSKAQRNMCWNHAIENGNDCFWLLDDNIKGWYYFNQCQHEKMQTPIHFNVLEAIMDRKKDKIGIVSHNYFNNVPAKTLRPPLSFNCKNYSSLLINVKLLGDTRFRLMYNEDVDLTLQCLEKHYFTVGTNIFLCDKQTTGTVKGGNADIYGKKDGENKFKNKYDCLFEQWKKYEGVVSMVKHGKDKIPHHKVDYKKFCKTIGFNDVL